MLTIRALGLVGFLALEACRDFDVICTDELRPGISVEPIDSVTSANVVAGAKLVARDGTYADSMSIPESTSPPVPPRLYAAWERPGIYTATVTRSGYQAWSKSGVRVTKDQCHVQTVELTARLQPQ